MQQEHIELPQWTRRTEILRYRQLVIDVVAAAFPSFLCVAVIVASARIKIARQLSIQELEFLLSELVSEHVLSFDPSTKNYRFNSETSQSSQTVNIGQEEYIRLPKESFQQPLMTGTKKPFFSAQPKEETKAQRHLRLIQRRVTTFLMRQKQFERDISTLSHLLAISPNTTFAPEFLLPKLPPEWAMDKRRHLLSYIMQCLLYLCRSGRVIRNEMDGSFQYVSEPDLVTIIEPTTISTKQSMPP
jgi:hypothetical protein